MASPANVEGSEKTTIAEVTTSPVVIPGELFFGLYDDDGLKVEGGFRMDELVLTKHMPLVDQSFADKAVVLKDLELAFVHAISGTDAGNGFRLEVTLNLDGYEIGKLDFPLSGVSTRAGTGVAAHLAAPRNAARVLGAAAEPTTVPASAIFWINVQKSIGPVHIDRIGFNLAGDDIQILLDAGLATASFAVQLNGLSAQIPIFGFDSLDDIAMNLQGLSVYFSAAMLTIEGGLLHSNVGGADEYDGALMIKTPDLSVTAIGAFTSLTSGGTTQNSLFGFAFLDKELGGPPAFFVTGLSAGFGYNRVIKTPKLSEVGSFPLLAGLSDPSKLGLAGGGLPTVGDLGKVFATIDTFIIPKIGEYWFAAGIQFTSFELIHSNVVAILEVGKEFEILVLGRSYGSFPPEGTTYGYVELDLDIVLQPDQGIFRAEAGLSPNSFVLDRDCHLTGGFAFYCWFGSNPHAGDFVFTVGGYHPAFRPPDHYPVPARLGFNWQVSGDVSIKGGAYFALTPACIMAGGSLEVLYASGRLRAWFTAYADLLIYWKPFYFVADIGVDVGVSYHANFLFVSKTLSFELGANVALHGPPTGGSVTIHLWIISFTVDFGAASGAGDQVLDWDQFKKMVVQPRDGSRGAAARALAAPAAANGDLCRLTIGSGLLDQVQDTPDTEIWLVRSDELTITAASAVPMTHVSLNGAAVNTRSGALAIRPMRIGAITSSVGTITVTSKDGNPMAWKDPVALERAMPQALWGSPVDQPSRIDPNGSVIGSCLVGLQAISAKSTFEPSHTGAIDVAQAFTYFTLYPDGSKTLPVLPISAAAPAIVNPAAQKPDARRAIIDPAIAATSGQRSAIVSALNAMIGFPAMDEAMTGFDAVTNFFTDPLIGKLAVQN